jgi:hypothetical protein
MKPKYDTSSDTNDDVSDINDEFKIYEKTTFWIYKISNNYWEQLNNLFKKKKFFISSFGPYKLIKHDIVLIYRKHTSAIRNGFVAMCQVCSNMKQNTSNLKIYNDINMNKYYCEVDIVCIFDSPYKLTNISKTLKDMGKIFNFSSIKKICTKNELFTAIDQSTGKNIIRILSEGSQNSTKNANNNDSSSESESISNSSSESDTYSELSSETELSDDDDILVIRGHIPIIMTPCHEFVWDQNPAITIKNFKKHYKFCNMCEKTDNNNCSLLPILEKAEVYSKELKDDEKLEEYLEYYYNLKNYTFELIDDDKKYDHVYLYRINNRSHIYHRCILIVW